MGKTINLIEFLKIIKKRLLLIISLTVISVGIAAVLSFYVLTPIYQAETQILVNQKVDSSQQTLAGAQNLETDLQLINTYNVIITSPVILTIVIEKLDLKVSPEQLKEQITVTNASNSQVINIRVNDKSPEVAVEISNTLAEVFKEEIPVLMSVDNITILSNANAVDNPVPIKPNKIINMVIAAIIGLFVGVGIANLLEIFDRTIKSEQEVEEILGLPIIGSIGFISHEFETNSKLQTYRGARGN